jgi:hypothetical protein
METSHNLLRSSTTRRIYTKHGAIEEDWQEKGICVVVPQGWETGSTDTLEITRVAR